MGAKMKDHRVFITGMGIISSIGNNLSEFEHSLQTGRCGIGYLQPGAAPPIAVKIGAEIPRFSFSELLKQYASLPIGLLQLAKQCTHRGTFSLQTSVLATLEAWQDALLHEKPILPERIGLIVAGSNLSQNLQYGLHSKFLDGPEYLTPTYALQFLDTNQVGVLSEIFKIQGEGFTVGGASASGNIGIIKGYQLVKSNLADVCVVAGPLTDLSPMELQGFLNIGAMGGHRFGSQPEKACRPFDQEHEGFIYGQASGCLILESEESAVKRQAKGLVEILGGAIVLDGNRLSNPNQTGEAKAMEKALNQAELGPDTIEYINAHGSSSPLGDETELKAIRQVFQHHVADIWINSTKSLTGHCLYSAGIVEAIATAVQIRKKFVHPNLNLENPLEPEFRFSGATAVGVDIQFALSNSFGFGGINTSIAFKGVNNE
jgi:malonyl-ACP decarboxylase